MGEGRNGRGIKGEGGEEGRKGGGRKGEEEGRK